MYTVHGSAITFNYNFLVLLIMRSNCNFAINIIHDCIKQYAEDVRDRIEIEEAQFDFKQTTIYTYIGILHNHARTCTDCSKYLHIEKEMMIMTEQKQQQKRWRRQQEEQEERQRSSSSNNTDFFEQMVRDNRQFCLLN